MISLQLVFVVLMYFSQYVNGEMMEGDHRIVGGVSVSVSNYPFIALLMNEGIAWCGGSILRKEYPAIIITAAHCSGAFDSDGDIVRLYANDINGDSNSIDSKISKSVIYPNYGSPNDVSNDIALLWLRKDISSYSELATVEIDRVSTDYECCNSGDDLQVIGYGADCSGCGSTPTLEFVNVDYVDRAVCDVDYESYNVDNTMICAALLNSDSCQGDSGGPLIKKDTYKQVGIVSWGIGCAHPDYPGVYTNLGVFYDWIYHEIGRPGVRVYNTIFANIGAEISGNQRINNGEALVSANRNYVAGMQSDGNFVIYDLRNGFASASALWASNTWNTAGDFMIYQNDGNFVLYTSTWTPLWDSNTHGYSVGSVIMQNDGNLVVYDASGDALWASNTWQSSTIYLILELLIAILLVINIICIAMYCYNKKYKKRRKYKIVSMESSDYDNDAADVENLINNK